ncbi:glycosyltransferase [Siphonobacter sp. SORGH_AS_1065]|uniref:glycosyltransferase n=1 Tax=Siphonobacter sp. SORGH_AS_1065 TaxID=3041795 RepID=UPI00278B0595|nr:glycosyltransferase [Siphonobacter sp. SORGH_AS_1065]MDQ1090085.1 hypothetical protein [Siphonobacter sp. SORGH_AS_1065]
MPCNVAFYIHHHGAGHLMRSIAIAEQLTDCSVTFLGSHLRKHQSLIPSGIQWIDLPMDTAQTKDIHYQPGPEVGCLHYAPLAVSGLSKRMAMLTQFLVSSEPLILVVDVSVEVTLLARLLGIPTLVIRQHGYRTDLAHRTAYESAQLLIAPYPDWMSDPQETWMEKKTFYSGGFSRFTSLAKPLTKEVIPRQVAVLLGQGGNSFNESILLKLADQCPEYQFHVLGILPYEEATDKQNLVFHGRIDHPLPVLMRSEIVIGNAGHNTVMEMADLEKKFICIAEERPFAEQQHKASFLRAKSLAITLSAADLPTTHWPTVLAEAQELNPVNWQGTINPGALTDLALAIKEQWNLMYAYDFKAS